MHSLSMAISPASGSHTDQGHLRRSHGISCGHAKYPSLGIRCEHGQHQDIRIQTPAALAPVRRSPVRQRQAQRRGPRGEKPAWQTTTMNQSDDDRARPLHPGPSRRSPQAAVRDHGSAAPRRRASPSECCRSGQSREHKLGDLRAALRGRSGDQKSWNSLICAEQDAASQAARVVPRTESLPQDFCTPTPRHDSAWYANRATPKSRCPRTQYKKRVIGRTSRSRALHRHTENRHVRRNMLKVTGTTAKTVARGLAVRHLEPAPMAFHAARRGAALPRSYSRKVAQPDHEHQGRRVPRTIPRDRGAGPTHQSEFMAWNYTARRTAG